LPALLVHPPNHRFHVHSLCLSLLSLRKCLTLVLNPDVECRAWTAFAEIGMTVIGGGFHTSTEHPWAKGIDIEVCYIFDFISSVHRIARGSEYSDNVVALFVP